MSEQLLLQHNLLHNARPRDSEHVHRQTITWGTMRQRTPGRNGNSGEPLLWMFVNVDENCCREFKYLFQRNAGGWTNHKAAPLA